MGRRELPLYPADEPAVQLAHGLRELRRAAGLTYRQLAQVAHYHHTVLWRAASGATVPSWQVTIAFVTGCANASGCAADTEFWHARWTAAAQGQVR